MDPSFFQAEIENVDRLADVRLAVRDGMRIKVPKAARPLVRTLCAAFDARLAESVGRHAPAV